jgi:hypothetical protein
VAEISTWYHGTSRDSARLIGQRGITAANYGLDPHGLGWPYHVLARHREQVEPWAHRGGRPS